MKSFAINKRIRLIKIPLILLVISSFSNGCKKFLEVAPPPTRVASENVYNSDATAASVLTGLYTQMMQVSYLSSSTTFSIASLSGITGLSADELTFWSGALASTSAANIKRGFFYRNALVSDISASHGGEFWNNFYQYVYVCNEVVENLSSSKALTPAVRDQLLGEALFMRSFLYFNLLNLYGDVPLVLSTDHKVSSLLSRFAKDKVYEQIVLDLTTAESLLSEQYLKEDAFTAYGPGSEERVRPTKWAAQSLLARVYLFKEDWINAESQSTAIIDNNNLFDLSTDVSDVFKKNSSDTIWALQPVNTGWNTEDARFFIFSTAAGPTTTNPVYLSKQVLSAFEPTDQRASKWINRKIVGTDTFNYSFKYKSATQNSPVTEYLIVLRLSEQYLIRAEARARQGHLQEAISDLNIVRSRAGLPDTSTATQEELLGAILHERQVEFFTEMGHRWFDLKRTRSVNAVMSIVTPLKGGVWESTAEYYPIPFKDLQLNPNLVQNEGY